MAWSMRNLKAEVYISVWLTFAQPVVSWMLLLNDYSISLHTPRRSFRRKRERIRQLCPSNSLPIAVLVRGEPVISPKLAARIAERLLYLCEVCPILKARNHTIRTALESVPN